MYDIVYLGSLHILHFLSWLHGLIINYNSVCCSRICVEVTHHWLAKTYMFHISLWKLANTFLERLMSRHPQGNTWKLIELKCYVAESVITYCVDFRLQFWCKQFWIFGKGYKRYSIFAIIILIIGEKMRLCPIIIWDYTHIKGNQYLNISLREHFTVKCWHYTLPSLLFRTE